MNSVFSIRSVLSSLLVLCAGCASTVATVPGAAPGRFVTMSCAENKSFQLRVAEDGQSVRVRGHHGSAELDAQAGGVFAGAGYVLRTQGEGAIGLDHQGKPQARQCKSAA